MYSSSFQSNTQKTNINTSTSQQYASLGENFGYNQYLDELGTKLDQDQSVLKGLGEFSAQLEKHYKLDRVMVPPSRGRDEIKPEKMQRALVKYNQLTFGEKEVLLAKLVQKIIGNANANANADNDDDKTPMRNLMFDLLFLQQTPPLVSPRYIATPTKSLVSLGAKINTLANDPAVLEALAKSSAHKLEHPLSLRNCTIFLLSATTGILVGYLAMYSLGPMSFFPGLHKDSLTIGFKVYTIIRSAEQGRTLKESLEIMARTGARELLQYSSASMLMGLTSKLTGAGGAAGYVEKHLGYLACRMVTFMTNSGVQVMMQNIKFIQPSTREMALAKERTAQQKLQQEQQDFIDLCNEIQTGYRTPLRVLKSSFHTFKITLDAKTKRHPYVASMLIVAATSVLCNTILDRAIGEGASALTQLPFGLYDKIPTFLDTSLIKESLKRTHLYPFVFRTINELVPLKKQVMAQMTALLKMSPDEFITMEKIVERKLTMTVLFKNIVRFLTNAAVTITQEDFIRGGVSYDFVNKADTLYTNLNGSLTESMNKILSLPQEHMHHLFQEATRVFTSAAESIEGLFQGVKDMAQGIETITGVQQWFQSSLDTLYSQISATFASSKTDAQESHKNTVMSQISDDLHQLQARRQDNNSHMEVLVASIKSLEDALAGNKDILFAGQIDQITGDLAHLRATIDGLQGQNKAIDDLTAAFGNDVKPHADSTTFHADGGGIGTSEGLDQFAQQVATLLGTTATANNSSAAAEEVARTAQKQIADNRAHYEGYTEMSRLHKDLKTLLPSLNDANLPLRTEALSMADIQARKAELQEALASMQAHQENKLRLADNELKLKKITEKATDELCNDAIIPFWSKTCKQLAEEDLTTLAKYAESWKGFEDKMTAALNRNNNKSEAAAMFPQIPPYPFKINPSLRKFVTAWQQIDTLTKNPEDFKFFEGILDESGMKLTKIVTNLINDKSGGTTFSELQTAIKSAKKESLIDKTHQMSVTAEGNLQQVSMSQAHNLYVKNDPLASSHTKERMRTNFLQTTNNVQAMMGANRASNDLHEKVLQSFRNLGNGQRANAPSLEEIDAVVAQNKKVTDEVAATQGALDEAILLDYTNHVFKTKVVTNVEKGENPEVADFSQVKITLPAIRAFNERNTRTMFDGLLRNNPLFQSKLDVKGPMLDTEMAMMIEEAYHETLDNFLLPPTHPNYDARANQIIRDTLLEDPANVDFQSLLKMRNGLDEMLRQQAVTAGLALSSFVPAIGPLVAGASAASSLLFTAAETVTGLETSIDNSMKFLDYFARFAKTDNHASLNLARNTILQVQKVRLHGDKIIDPLVQYVRGILPLPVAENRVNFKNFIANMVVTGKTSDTFQEVFLKPIFKDRTTSGWFLNDLLNSIPVLGTAKVGSEILFDISDAMAKGALTDNDTHLTYLLFGHGFDFERMGTMWKSSAAHAESWFSWAARSTSPGDEFVKYFFTSRESEQFNILFSFYSANRGQIYEMCRSGGISTQLAFLCPNTNTPTEQPLFRV
jgi:hypothetical protein